MRTPRLFLGVFALALILPLLLLACGGADDEATLIAFYNATGGPNWESNDNWLSDRPVGEWEGVTTDDNGRVTGLGLNENQLSGCVPSSLSGRLDPYRSNLN